MCFYLPSRTYEKPSDLLYTPEEGQQALANCTHLRRVNKHWLTDCT